MDCIAFYFHLFTACMSSFSQSTGLRGTAECDLHNTEISLVCVALFFLLVLLVCVEMGVSVTECLGGWRKGKLTVESEQ